MRDAYHDELGWINDQLVDMTRLVRSAVSRATTALLDADLQVAEGVIDGDDAVDRLNHEIEARAFDLMARQQPVARDLRTLLTALRMSGELERMGDMATHVAKLARLRHPLSPIPPELHATMLEMGQIAERIVAKAGSVIASGDVATARELDRDDDRMDHLHRRLFGVLFSPNWQHGVEPAVDVSLCSRYYERYADHAVSVARRVIYLVTGEDPSNVAETAASGAGS